MLVCVCGGMGKTSLVHRLMYGTFSLWHRPTVFREVHHGASMDVVDVPSTEHGVPMRCDVLVLIDCAEGMALLRRWFGLYHHLVVVRRGVRVAHVAGHLLVRRGAGVQQLHTARESPSN